MDALELFHEVMNYFIRIYLIMHSIDTGRQFRNSFAVVNKQVEPVELSDTIADVVRGLFNVYWKPHAQEFAV